MTLRRLALAFTLALSPFPLLAQDAAPKADPLAGFGWLRELAGSCCKAEEGGRVSCWNWGSDGTSSPGEYLADGDLFRYPLPRKGGSTAPEQRMTWKRLDTDSVRVSREKKDGEAWTESFAVVYTRVRP